MAFPDVRRKVLLLWTFCVLIGIVKPNFINFKPGYEYEYKLETSSTVKHIGEFHLKAKVGYINVGEQSNGQEIFLRIRTFSFSQASSPHTAGHDIDLTKWFSFIINRQGEINKVFYDKNEDDEIIAIKKGMAAMFAARLQHEDEKTMEKTSKGWQYHVQELGHEGLHNSTYHVEHHSGGKKYTKTRHEHPVKNAKSNYTKTMYFNSELGTIHTVDVDEIVSVMEQTVPGYDPYEGQRPTKPVTGFSNIKYPEMSALGKGKLEFQHQHKVDSKPDRKYLDIITDSIHVQNVKKKPIRSHTPQLILEQIRGNLTIMRNQPDEKATKITTDCFHKLMACIEQLDDEHFYNLTNYYLSLEPYSKRNEKDRNHILDAVTGTWTERAQNVVTEKVLNNPEPDVQLIMRLMVHIITVDTVPTKKLLNRLLELGLEPHKSPLILREGDAYHRILLTIGSVSRKLHQSRRTKEASESMRKIEKMLGYHDPYNFRKKRSTMTEEQIEFEDTLKVNLLGALGNARLAQSYEHIVSHINSTNCQWIKRAGITALRGYHHFHAAELMLNTAKYDEHETVRYEALIQYQLHPHARQLTPLYQNSSYNGSSMYFNPWNLDSHDIVPHSRNKRKIGLIDGGFVFVLKSPSIDFQKMIGSEKIGASFGIIIKNVLDLKIAVLSGHAIVDVHDEAYARVHLGIIGKTLDFFLARVCFKGSAEYNLNLLKEFGINNIKDLVKIYDTIKNKVIGGIKNAVNFFKDIIQGKISIGKIVHELKDALEQLPKKVLGLGHKAMELMKKLGEMDIQDLPPFIYSIRNLVTRVVNFYNDIKKDVIGFYNKLLEAVTIIIPRAAKQIFKSVRAIIDAFKHFFNDPKKAMMGIGGNVLNIGMEVKNLIAAIHTTKDACFFLKKEKPYWFDMKKLFGQVGEFRELAKKVGNDLKTGGKKWTDQIIAKGSDQVAILTKGKFTMTKLKQYVINELQTLLIELLNPFSMIKNLGGDFLKRFMGLFKLVEGVKDAYNTLKEGYRNSRSLLDRLFGPKCSSDFPKRFRTPGGGCNGEGFYPSELKKANEYRVEGVDLLISRGTKIVAPFPGYIRKSETNDNEVIIQATGGSLKDTDIIITNVNPNSTIYKESDTDYTENLVQANQIIGDVTSSECGTEDHIHFAMMKSDGGVIDPSKYLEPRLLKLPKWKQGCDDYKLVWKFDLIAEGSIVGGKGKKSVTEEPERTGGTEKPPIDLSDQEDPAKVLDKGLFGKDTMFGKVQSNKDEIDKKTSTTKDKGFKDFFKRTGAFLKKFSIQNLNVGGILDLLNILGLDKSKQSLANVILKIKEIIDDKPCFNPYQLSDDQLRSELVERGKAATGSRQTMIAVLTSPNKKCAAMSLNMPKNIYCTFDQHCLGIECCVHLKVFMFLKTYKVYARFDPCQLEFIMGIKGKFNKHFRGFKGIYGGFQQDVKPGVKIDLLGGMELIIRVEVEKTESVVLASLKIGFCSIEDPESCMPFLNLMHDTIIPLPICNPDGSYTFPKVDWKEYYSRDAVKKRLKESAKKLAEQSIKYGIKEAAKAVGLPKEYLEETPPCPRPEILTQTILTDRLKKCGLSTIGSLEQLRSRLLTAEKSCELFGKTLTLPSIKNDRLNKIIYMQIRPNCMYLQACVDIQIRTKIFNFTKALNAYVELDTCNFLLNIGFEGFKHPIILVGYKWGTAEEIPFGDKIKLRFNIDKDSDRKMFIINLGLTVKLVDSDSSIDGQLVENMKIPIPICNDNFSLPGGGSIKEFAKALGGKLSTAAINLIFQKFGLDKVFQNDVCRVDFSPTDCPWTIDVNQYLPASLKDKVTCGMPEDCFGLNCCMDFEFKIPFVDRPVKKSALVFAKFDPCEFQLTVGFGDFIHTEKFISYQWGTPVIITIGNGKPAPISLTFLMNKYIDGFIIDLNVLACVPIDGDMLCFPDEGLDLMKRVRIPACNARDLVNLTSSDFNLDDYFKEIGQEASKKLANSGAQFLMDKLGITPLLLEKRCDVKRKPYSPNTDGWSNNCPNPIKKLPKLPKGLICHIGESCTKIKCCFDVEFMDMSFYAFLNLDMCYYYLEAAIESEYIKYSLFNDKYDLNTGINGNIKISSFFQLEFNVRKVDKWFLVDMDIRVCFNKDKCQESFTVLRGAEIPQFVCDLNAKNFSITQWAKDKGLNIAQGFADKAIDVFLEQTGLADKMLKLPCSRDSFKYQPSNNNWKNDCPKIQSLPEIKLPVNCYISDYCSAVDCCMHSNLLKRSLNAFLNIDSCNYLIEGAIEKFSFKFDIVNYNWGQLETKQLGEFVFINFKIDRRLDDKVFIVDLSLKMCFQSQDNCEFDLPVLIRTKLPMPLCNMKIGFKFTDFNMKNWLAERGGDMTSILANQLFDYLDITKFLKDPMCSFNRKPFKTAAGKLGWNNKCLLNMTLPVLPNTVGCYIPDYCTGISCCIDVPAIRRSFQAHLLIDTCNFVLSVGIENIVYNMSIVDYVWGKEESIDIGGIFQMLYTVEDFSGENQFLVNLKLAACFVAGQKCDVEIPVFTNMRVPKILCDWEATSLALKDFKLDEWLAEQGGQFTDAVIDKLLETFDITPYLKTPMCKQDSAPFTQLQNGWKNECPLDVNLPTLPSGIVGYVPDFCTGITFCLDVPIIKRSFQASANIDMCSNVLSIFIEKTSYRHSLDYYKKWGVPDHFNLRGVIRIDYVIDNLEGEKQYVLSMNMSVCLSSDKPCQQSISMIKDLRIPKLFCDWEATAALRDFSLKDFLAEQNENIGDKLSALTYSRLFEALNISRFVQEPACDKESKIYSPSNAKGWKYDCPIKTLDFGKLPDFATCRIPDFCTGIDCCIMVPVIGRSFNAKVYLNACDFTLYISLEKLVYKRDLFHYKWGKKEQFNINRVLGIEYTIYNLDGARQYLISLSASFCFDSLQCLNVPILTDARIPKVLCDWESDYSFTDFYLTNWLTENGLSTVNELSSLVISRIFDEMKISQYLLDTPCDVNSGVYADVNGWYNKCTQISNLPPLSNSLTCHIPDTCTGIKCCVPVPRLKRSFEAEINLDPCNFKFLVGIENFKFNRNLINYQWGTKERLSMKNFIILEFTVDDLDEEKKFVINLNISVCLEKNKPCLISVPVLTNTKIPKLICDWDSTLALTDFSLSVWLKEQQSEGVQTLTAALRAKLYEHFKIAQFIKISPCQRSAAPYSSANGKGWTNDCSVNNVDGLLPQLPDYFTCHLGSRCTQIDCCVDVSYLGQSIYVLLDVNMCDFTLTASIENLVYKQHLFNYKWGVPHHFYMKGVFRIDYTLTKKDEERSIEISATISVCLSEDNCLFATRIVDKAIIPQPLCNYKQSLALSKFSLNALKIREQLPTTAQLTDLLISKVLEETELADYLLEPGCNRESGLYLNSNSKHWIKDCPLLVTLPSLPNAARCYWSSDCGTIDCCVYIGLIKRTVHASVNIDVCNLQMTLSLGKFEYVLSLFDYKWGIEDVFHIGGRVRLYYKLENVPGQQKIKTDIKVKVCFEDDSCIFDQVLLQQVEIPYSPCDITKPVPFKGVSFDFWKLKSCQLKKSASGCSTTSLPSPISKICRVDNNCLGVSCCVGLDLKYLGSYSLAASFNLDHCGNKLTYSLESKIWEKTLETVPKDRNVTEVISESIDISYYIHDAGASYVVTLNLRLCALNTYQNQNNCKYWTILDQKSFVKPVCNGRRKRRSAIKAIPQNEFETGLKELLDRDATNEEIGDFINEVRDSEEIAIDKNLSPDWKDDGKVNNVRSALKTMGSSNPSTILYTSSNDRATVSVEGNKELSMILNSAARITLADEAEQSFAKTGQTFIVGKGLTGEGVKLLGVKLSNMTIGEIITMIHTKNIDPEKALNLVKEIRNLALALYSEVMNAVLTGKGGNIFKSMDFTLQGDFSFPQQSLTFFDFSKHFLLVVVPMQFRFGAGCTYGMKIVVGGKILKMAVFGGATPYGSLVTYGELNIGFILYAGLRLEGAILTTSFPTRAEIGFSKFPLDIRLTMDVELIPLQLRLSGVVTLKINLIFVKFVKTLFKKTIWKYSTPTIRKRMIDFGKNDKDESPPAFSEYTDKQSARRKRAAGLPINTPTRQCSVRQLPGRDHTEPAIEISARSDDDKSQVRLFLIAGTKPGLSDALPETQLGGPSSVITTKLTHDGVPIYFTLIGKNSGDGAATVTCSIPTYDTSLPGGRFTAEFSSSSNPRVLKASVVVFEDSDLIKSSVGVGFGRGIYGDEIEHWTPRKLREKDNAHYDAVSDDHGYIAETHFTSSKKGRLIAPKAREYYGVKFFQACLKKCLELPESKCLSVNYDYGKGEHCELLEAIEGHDHKIATFGKYIYMERLGVGMADEFYYKDKLLEHNKIYYFNLDLKNTLGYRNIISTEGVIIDTTTPVPGEGLMNATSDTYEKTPCQNGISFDRPDYNSKCIGQSDLVPNHRIIIDGPGSNTVFNGHTPLFDLRYTRANRFLSANWDGIHDKETGVLVYSFTAGTKPCEESAALHPHHDPHKHHHDESEWTNIGLIKKTSSIPDGIYYVTVRALNKVEYGGPLATTFCHSVPYIIDNTVPFVYEVFNVRYDEESKNLSTEYNATDPESDVKEVDICLGKTTRDCYIKPWVRYPHSGEVIHNTDLPGGIPIWIKIKAWNNVNISALRSADHPLVLDTTPPIAGEVYDGPIFKHDLQYTKDSNKICANWLDFYDPESGIAYFSVFVRASENDAYLTNGTDFDHRTHQACVDLDNSALQHNKKYYIELWAFNAGHKQLNVSGRSDGVVVDLTLPVQGQLIDGRRPNFVDVEFSAAAATISSQWKGQNDPESDIKHFELQILRAQNNSSKFGVLRDWLLLNSDKGQIEQRSFHLKHRDQVKTKLKTTNGALGYIVEETDGYIVDLTPPSLVHLNDGNEQNKDIDYQSSSTGVDATFKFVDEESGVDHYKYQVYQQYQGSKHQIYPTTNGDWEDILDSSAESLSVNSLVLTNGGRYSVRISAVNRASAVATFDTNGFKLDDTPPEMRWVHVGVFNGELEDDIDGVVIQADKSGIKATWFATDDVSGIKDFYVSVGTSEGGQDILAWKSFGSDRDGYIDNLLLQIKTASTPFYYVSVKAKNGAGLESSVFISKPVKVVDEDKAGIVIDGADGTNEVGKMGVDADYQRETGTVTVQFSGFESAQHGITQFDWAIGTSSGGEEVQPFIEAGLIHEERDDVPGNGIASDGFGQAIVGALEPGIHHYITVRGITNAGNVLESTSDGFNVDINPPIINIESMSEIDDKHKLKEAMKIYQSEVDSISADWVVQDRESNISGMWYSVGTYPDGIDIKPPTPVSVYLSGEGSLPVGDVKPTADGRANIVNFWAVNNVGIIGTTRSATLIVDTSSPTAGIVTCPIFIQPHSSMKCTWDGFVDAESPIEEFAFGLGTQEGLTDVIQPIKLPGYTMSHLVSDLAGNVSHGKRYYATVTAKNAVGKTISAVSNSISVDITPPEAGRVVELSSEYIINVTSDRSTSELNSYSCNTVEACNIIDAVCQESLSSINIAWSSFTDPETDVVRYEVAVGTTPGGGQVKPFFIVPVNKRYMTIENLVLNGLKQVYVTVKATNEAGLSTISISNGIYLSYVSQGKPPLSHIGVWDGNHINGDINYQTDRDTIKARWDVSGDPCPVSKYEWAIVRMDGLKVQDFIDSNGLTVVENDQLSMKNGERYYILLRVTTAMGYIYTLRSDGVTVQETPLVPGQVNDGDVVGFDLNKLLTKRKVSGNWDGFGDIEENSEKVVVESGNPGVPTSNDKKSQEIEYYEVALGKDRRFPKTRDNVVPFTNVFLNKTVTFYDLDLVILTATYYFTVRAYSKSFSMAEVTSNGFQIGYDDGVEAGRIVMPKFVKSATELEIQWNGFESKVGMLMYYIALSNKDTAGFECRQFIEGGSLSVEEREKIFDLRDVENVGKDTYKQLHNLTLQQNNGYSVTVIGVDKAGECNLTNFSFHVDITPPAQGQMKVGPYYDMKMSFTSTSESLTVDWIDYADDESGIKCFRVSLIEEASCQEGAARTVIVQPIEINENFTSYKLLQLDLKPSRPYIIKLEVENLAGLVIEAETTPIIYDVSTPTAGHVVDGLDYKQDVVWSNSVSTVTGAILHLPTNVGSACPSQDIKFTEAAWAQFVSKKNYNSSGQRLHLKYRAANVLLDELRNFELEIKLARDVKEETMFSGGYYRDADMVNGGKYELNIQAADGDGKAVTSIVLWDGPESELIDYDYTKEVDWTLKVCACCRVNKDDPACLKTCDCEEYLESKKIVKRSSTDNQPSYVQDLTEAERADLIKNSGEKPAKSQAAQKLYRSCGIQILAGEAQKVITWCRFENNINQPMKSERKLTFDPSKSINNYRLEFSVLHEEATEGTWCFNVYVNDEEVSELCGIPRLSTNSKLFLHVWNWKNYLPPLPDKIEDKFTTWSTKAIFQNLIMPPSKDALCRFGNPFRGGTNGIVKFKAGVGRTPNTDSVVAFIEVLSPCLPCVIPCDRYSCDPNCAASKFTEFDITLDNLDLQPTEIENGTTKSISYYLSVKAVLGSGQAAISSSDGFYIDATKPVFDTEAMLYMDVSQGNFTPVTFQGSNSTIRVIYLCQDNESLVVEYQWGIGSSPGQLDIQDFVSTGINPSGTNSKLEGVLENNSTYYVSVKCINGARLETIYQDYKGVTVFMYAPDIDDVGTNITGAVKFDEPVSPPTAMKSVDDRTIGCSWTVSADPSIREYDFGVGSSELVCDDIFPYTWVGYNVSGEVAIKDGFLQVNDVKISPIGTFNPKYNDTTADNGPTGLKMEPGRTLFLCMKMCNEARRCTVKNIGSSVIVDSDSKMATSTNGESIKLSLGSVSGRKKRDVIDIVVETSSGLDPGQSLLMTPLTNVHMEADYRSDASTDFVTYITNPATTINDDTYLHRLLLNRLTSKPADKSFSITSIGHHSIPGPLIVTIKYNPATVDNDKLPMLIHWNPINQKWELSKKTCQNEINTEVIDTKNGEIRTKVCNTWRKSEAGSSRRLRAIQSDTYFNEDTQFMVTDVLKAIPNSPPVLTSDTSLTMNEDGGTLVYQLKSRDMEGDDVTYKLGAITTQKLTREVNLTSQGLLVFVPCNDCYGNIKLPIEITEIQTDAIPAAVTKATISVTVSAINDAPTVFSFEDNRNLLPPDPTESVMVLLDQNRVGQNDTNVFSWTFGVYDVDVGEELRLFIDRPKNGSVKISPPFETAPKCGPEAKGSMLPCDVMSLPHPATKLQWLYYTLTYEPEEGTSGYDEIRLFILDKDRLSSDVVTLKMGVMIMPCINDGTCESTNVNDTYTCQDSRRAESFDDYYKCSCREGWTGSRCHEDFDECSSSPCIWPYVCYNYQNRYACACPLDEPNCDAMVGWMIALIVIAVILVIVITVLVAYICLLRKGRVIWSNLFNRFDSDSTSDNDKIFENEGYDGEVEPDYPKNGLNEDCPTISRNDKTDDDSPSTSLQFGPSTFNMTAKHAQSRNSLDDGGNSASYSQQIGPSTFDMTAKHSQSRNSLDDGGNSSSSSQQFGPSTFDITINSPKSGRNTPVLKAQLISPPTEKTHG